MNDLHIQVRNLRKTYHVPVRPEGLGASVRSLLHPTYDDVPAVKDISFDVNTGEMVGFIGPNGAGKTTTLKMLSGLIHPTSGEVTVLGYKPWKREADYLRKISIVMGNKSQMLWDIPPMDSFRVLSEIYNVPAVQFKQTLDEIISLLDMQELLTRPVRNLSLGERMKCELAACLLHAPEVLFLDEPTIGLDIVSQRKLRSFLQDYNARYGLTIMLTSHYMQDIKELCQRVIVINHGVIVYDGSIRQLVARYAGARLVRLTWAEPLNSTAELEELRRRLSGVGVVKELDAWSGVLEVPGELAARVAAEVAAFVALADVQVYEPDIENVLAELFVSAPEPVG